ncbi:hypothetical protein DFJ74DRAFT_470315 [Hyaloraphidium curvatum]|nr:hypothetical protein DFJ74DRAFT_470315 [Hyaloraphidium curvatum]
MGSVSALEKKMFLLAGGLPPSVPRRFGLKSKERVSKWEMTEFTNPARGDELVLKHWEKKRKAEDEATDPEDYPFVKFNVVLDVPEYTADEYERHLRFDAHWGKGETDYLFEMCRQYDCRFPVIADLYEYGDSKRSIEDLKERYYKICKKIFETRIARGQDVEENQRKLDTGCYEFDKSMELSRKRQLETLYNRSLEQVKDEELLFTELKRREAMNERFFETRQWAERTYGKHELAHSQDRAMVQNAFGGQGAFDPRLKKKRRDDIPGGPSITIPPHRNSIIGLPSATPTTPGFDDPSRKQKVAPVGTSLRSATTITIKGQNVQKMTEYLDSLGVPALPTMPTAQTMRAFEELRSQINVLIDWKKQEETLENNVRVLRIRRDNMNALGMSPSASPISDLRMDPGLSGKFPKPSGGSHKKKR